MSYQRKLFARQIPLSMDGIIPLNMPEASPMAQICSVPQTFRFATSKSAYSPTPSIVGPISSKSPYKCTNCLKSSCKASIRGSVPSYPQCVASTKEISDKLAIQPPLYTLSLRLNGAEFKILLKLMRSGVFTLTFRPKLVFPVGSGQSARPEKAQ